MNKRKHQPAFPETLEREARQWDSGAVTTQDWKDAPEAIPRVGGSTLISLRLPTQMLEILKAFAEREGVGYQVLLKQWLDDRIRQERLVMHKEQPRVKTGSNDNSVEGGEHKVKAQTTAAHSQWLAVFDQLLNAWLSVLRALGKFTPTQENRREQLWLLLTYRSFNSLRWAREMLLAGYYAQPMILTRTVYEDWLTGIDAIEHAETVDALLDKKGSVPGFKQMAERSLPDELKGDFGWGDDSKTYGFLSTFTHPRARAVLTQVDPDTMKPRVGPLYDDALFVATFYYLLQAAVRSTEILARGAQSAKGVSEELQSALNAANVCLDDVLARATGIAANTQAESTS